MKDSNQTIMRALYSQYYRALVFITLLVVATSTFYVDQFQLDTSADALVLDNDPSLLALRDIKTQFGIKDYVLITYTPNDDLFSQSSINVIANLKNHIQQIENIASITSVIDVPLLRNGEFKLANLQDNIKNLQSPDVDLDAARQEMISSPLYKDQLVSSDTSTTALLVVFKDNLRYKNLLHQRNNLREKRRQGPLNESERSALRTITKEFQSYKLVFTKQRHDDISEIRQIIKSYKHSGKLFLGGAPMVADDMMTFVRKDIVVFGGGVIGFIILLLLIIFRQLRWIALPLLCCLFSCLIMVGLLGRLDWRVTVVSSNFISLMIIFTLSIVVHLTVKYQELAETNPQEDNTTLVLDTVNSMFAPCFYTAITTVVAFASLSISGIIPVIQFGWMMSIGILIALALTFTFFPAAVIWLGKTKQRQSSNQFQWVTESLANFTLNFKGTILSIAVLALIFSAVGISRLKVENSFINYFGKNTEIYAGMKLIDEKLGGTVPLEIVIDLSRFSVEEEDDDEEFDFDDDEDFSFDEVEEALKQNANQYWFTSEKMKLIKDIHEYLEAINEIGTVTSVNTFIQVAQDLAKKELSTFELALLYSKIPEQFHSILFTPYLSFDNNQVRFSARILDSAPNLNRNELILKIKHDLINQFELEESEIVMTGLLVMYNNMLQSLFSSQILTIWVVLGAIFLMLFALYRSLLIALIGILPNCLSAGFVLGLIGWFNIPLDMMTITIAAISIGIGVDGTIHYLHRFRSEFQHQKDYDLALKNAHGSIGNAIFYTSAIVVFGFSILCLSNFVPTIYFGLLTGAAMAIALLNNLTLLPRLILLTKPF